LQISLMSGLLETAGFSYSALCSICWDVCLLQKHIKKNLTSHRYILDKKKSILNSSFQIILDILLWNCTKSQ
jgi:hypothetical protein